MAGLNITNDLFLGKEELARLIDFLTTSGGFKSYLQRQTAQYGLLPTPDNFSVAIDDFSARTLRVYSGYAFDESANLLTGELTNGIQLPANNIWYWLKVKYKERTLEEGAVTVSTSGTVVGVGTKFTEVLRGAPDFPSIIRFFLPDGTLAPLNGTVKYEINAVVSDTELYLSDFNPSFNEADIKYAVVGTFTPTQEPSNDQEYVFRYDSVEFTLVAETTLNEQPAFGVGENENNTFWLARVQKTVSEFFVQDKRSRFWKGYADNALSKIDSGLNYVVGVEAVKFEAVNAPRANNNVYVAWGLKSESFTFIPETKQLTLATAIGGCVRNITELSAVPRDFSGWRVYKDSSQTFASSYCIVKSSSYPTASTLRLTLEVADPDFFATLGDTVYLVPDVEEITIKATPILAQDLGETTFTFPIRQQSAVLNLLVNDSTYTYKLEYRYKNHFDSGAFVLFPSDTETGYTTQYYDEFQFNANGQLIGLPTLSDYFDGEIILNRSPLAYSVVIGNLTTGEIRGVNYTTLDNAVFFRDVVVGTDKQYQVFENPSIILSLEMYLNLKSTDVNGDPVKEGSVFYFHFKQDIDLNGFGISVKQDSILSNPSGTGTLIREFTDLDLQSSKAEDGLVLKFIFDGTNWIYQRFTDFTSNPNIGVVDSGDYLLSWVSDFGIKYKVDFQGYIEFYGRVRLPAGSNTLAAGYNEIAEFSIPNAPNPPIVGFALPITSKVYSTVGVSYNETVFIEVVYTGTSWKLLLFQMTNALASVNNLNDVFASFNGRYPYKNV